MHSLTFERSTQYEALEPTINQQWQHTLTRRHLFAEIIAAIGDHPIDATIKLQSTRTRASNVYTYTVTATIAIAGGDNDNE